jgi:hypothetical protein
MVEAGVVEVAMDLMVIMLAVLPHFLLFAVVVFGFWAILSAL